MNARFLSIIPILLATASAQSLATPRLHCEVAETAGTTTLTAKAKGCEEVAVFRIDWKSGGETPAGFEIGKAEGGAITSTHRLGKTTVTRTILASAAADCIIIHVVADQPGAVSFNARFVSDHPGRIANRREIILSGEKTHAHAWILPFESDVHDDGKGIVSLHGEGEALIVLNLSTNAEIQPIADTVKRLGEKYDPGHSPPNPHRIWEGIRKNRSPTPPAVP